MKRTHPFLVGILLLALLAGCVPVQPPRAPIEPQAGHWGTWVLSSSAELRPAAPPDAATSAQELAELQTMMAANDDATKAQVLYWNAGAPTYRWLELALDRFAKGPPSPRVARGLALLNVAIYDAIVATWEAKYTYNRPRPQGITPLIEMPASPSYPSEHAAAAGAAAAVLSYLFPDEADFFAAQAQAAGQSRLYAGVHYPSDVDAGLALGAGVGAKVLEWAQSDGTNAEWDGVIPTGPDKWIGQNPVTPLAGTWKTWAIAAANDFLPPPPPAIDSEQMQAELAELKGVERTLPIMMGAWIWHSFDRAYPWWYRHISTRLFEQDRTANIPQATLMYTAMAVTQYDTIVACFNGKYTYWMIRPPQLDPEVVNLFPIPNHPSYPAAHSCGSMASAMVISEFFPEDVEMIQAAGHEAGLSRIWAGIHYPSDVAAGEALGKGVAAAVLARTREMTGSIQ
ncbi:MAG: phosphatase PAP2 family protein [Caldilineaceae bacterium]